MSALPPVADIGEGIAECPLLTHSGHCLVLSLRPDCLALYRVGLPLRDEALGLDDLDGGHPLARTKSTWTPFKRDLSDVQEAAPVHCEVGTPKVKPEVGE